MVNLGHGSSIATTQLTSESLLVSIHLQGPSDGDPNRRYYHEVMTDISIVLNSDQLRDLKADLLAVDLQAIGRET